MSYGAITIADIGVLEGVLSNYDSGSLIRFLEIGVHSGSTARGINEFCHARGVRLEYWGIDPVTPGMVFDGANFIQGDSAESFHLVPDGFDVVLIDGCHCINHVILDIAHYGNKVVTAGFMLLHDTAPHLQQTMRDPHGPEIPEFHNSVTAALKLIGFPDRWPWLAYSREYDPNEKIGGMSAYRKIP